MDIRKGQKESAGEIDVQELIDKTFGRRLIIWGAEADGQLGNRNHEEEKYAKKKEHSDRRIIGPYTKANRTEKGNGARLHRIRRNQQMIPTTTWKNPRWHEWINGNNRKTKQRRNGKEKTGKIYDNLDQSGRKHKKTH